MVRWLVGELVPTSLFSLRLPIATSTGGKTCLAPTPYALKLALVDAWIRYEGVERGKALFNTLRGRAVRFELPPRLVVSNALIRVAVPYESKVKASEAADARRAARAAGRYPFGSTVAFREFVHYGGPLRCAWDVADLTDEARQDLAAAWARLQWIGKRGGFAVGLPRWEEMEILPLSFSFPIEHPPATYTASLIVQVHDDLGLHAEFDRVSTYSQGRLEQGVDRIQERVAFPLRTVRFGRGYTSYVRSV